MAYPEIIIKPEYLRCIFEEESSFHGLAAGVVVAQIISDRYFGIRNTQLHRWSINGWWRTTPDGIHGLYHSAFGGKCLGDKFQPCHVGYRPKRIKIGARTFYV